VANRGENAASLAESHKLLSRVTGPDPQIIGPSCTRATNHWAEPQAQIHSWLRDVAEHEWAMRPNDDTGLKRLPSSTRGRHRRRGQRYVALDQLAGGQLGPTIYLWISANGAQRFVALRRLGPMVLLCAHKAKEDACVPVSLCLCQQSLLESCGPQRLNRFPGIAFLGGWTRKTCVVVYNVNQIYWNRGSRIHR